MSVDSSVLVTSNGIEGGPAGGPGAGRPPRDRGCSKDGGVPYCVTNMGGEMIKYNVQRDI